MLEMYLVVYFTGMCNNVGSICRVQLTCSCTDVQCGRYSCLWTYANNVKCMCTSVSGHIVDMQ